MALSAQVIFKLVSWLIEIRSVGAECKSMYRVMRATCIFNG